MSLGSLKPPFFFFSGDLFGDGDNTFFWAEFLPSRKKNILDSPRAGVEHSLFTGEGYKFLECRDSRVVVSFPNRPLFWPNKHGKLSLNRVFHCRFIFPCFSLLLLSEFGALRRFTRAGKRGGKGEKRRSELSPPLNEEICHLCCRTVPMLS